MLDQFYAFAQALRRGDENGYSLSPFAWRVDRKGLAYAVKDINKDGIMELLLSDEDNLNIALYTLIDNKPVEIRVFGFRDYVEFMADGTLYNFGSGGADLHGVFTLELSPGASELTQLTGYHQDGSRFFKDVDGKRQPITEEEFNVLYDKHRNPPNPMPLTFILIEQ